MKKLSYFKYLLALLLFPLLVSGAGPASDPYDYGRIFDYSLKLLTRGPVKKFLREIFREELSIDAEMQKKFGFPETISEMSESQFILLLQKNPKLWPVLDQYLKAVPEIKEDNEKQEEVRKQWRAKFKELIEDKGVLEEFSQYNDPTKPMPLKTRDGSAGYKNVRLFVNHQTVDANGTVKPAADLKQVWIDFIKGAKETLSMNVFDFDLEEVADALIERAHAGVEVMVGIDAGMIEERPEVKAIYKRLKAEKNLRVHPVDSVGLNHQKMIERDAGSPEHAAVLLSSGNATQSCSGPEGDLKNISPRPDYSIPNANHIITLDSQIAALVVRHELQKTLNPEYALRGREYPLGGAFQIFGEKKPGMPEAPYMVLAFSPRGALGDINTQLIAQAIRKTEGPIRMVQFAFSSKEIEEALLERAQAARKAGREFDFRSIGDTPFAMRDWSIFLSMTGIQVETSDHLVNEEGKKEKVYTELADSAWLKALGPDGFKSLRQHIHIAPKIFGTHSFALPDGTSLEVTSKVHHKTLFTNEIAIIGTSFNFSKGALTNNEQIVMFVHDPIVKEAQGIYDGLEKMQPETVEGMAKRRNVYRVEDSSKLKDIEGDLVGSHERAVARKKYCEAQLITQ